MSLRRMILIWGALAVAVCGPLALAATSPFLAWREPVYILAGFAGLIGMGLLLVQPLLVAGALPGLAGRRGRHLHRWGGAALCTAIFVHVAGLWVTSPPDVIDALLFVSPTPFSVWGVTAMWMIFAAASLALWRRRLRLRPSTWRLCHTACVSIAVIGSVVHAMLIEGTMEVMSKAVLCLFVVVATFWSIVQLRTSRRGN